jgi:hypothetical protein
MKFLIIVQDLRVSGTSQGIIERSFLFKLKKLYPSAQIDVLYTCHHHGDDHLAILPVNIEKKVISNKIPWQIKWYNRFYRRIRGRSFVEKLSINQYARAFEDYIRTRDLKSYDLIMVRSSGLNHENIRALKAVSFLNQVVINFHDPYPFAWYVRDGEKTTPNEFYRLKDMITIVNQAKACCSSAHYMSQDLKFLYAYPKPFHTIAHQFVPEAFDFSDTSQVRAKQRKLQISYHGALMFGRNLMVLIEAFMALGEQHDWIKQDVELILRIKGDGVNNIKDMVKSIDNILVLDCLDFSNSSMEQINESDVLVLLENGPDYCNILPGKAPFLFSLKKKVLISSPERSEMRKISNNSYKYIYEMNDLEDAKVKIFDLLTTTEINNEVFENYFSDANFKKQMEMILNVKTNDKFFKGIY